MASTTNFLESSKLQCSECKEPVIDRSDLACVLHTICSNCYEKSTFTCNSCESKSIDHLLINLLFNYSNTDTFQPAEAKATDIRNSFKNAEHASIRLQVQYHKAQNDINDTFFYYQHIVNNRKEELLKELKTEFSAKQIRLSDQSIQNVGELKFVWNYEAIEMGVRNTFGYVRSTSEASIGPNKQPPMHNQLDVPRGVAVNAQNDIIVTTINNRTIYIFDKQGRFKFQFGSGQLECPSRVAVFQNNIILFENYRRNEIQIYNQEGRFVRKFGDNILCLPRCLTVDNKGCIVVVESKPMRVTIFDSNEPKYYTFPCSPHLEFPNSVAVNNKQEIFISDNKKHCVKVFDYNGNYLRQIGGERITDYPVGVGINASGDILIAHNYSTFKLSIFQQNGHFLSGYESRTHHWKCQDVALMDDGSVVLASKDSNHLHIYSYE